MTEPSSPSQTENPASLEEQYTDLVESLNAPNPDQFATYVSAVIEAEGNTQYLQDAKEDLRSSTLGLIWGGDSDLEKTLTNFIEAVNGDQVATGDLQALLSYIKTYRTEQVAGLMERFDARMGEAAAAFQDNPENLSRYYHTLQALVDTGGSDPNGAHHDGLAALAGTAYNSLYDTVFTSQLSKLSEIEIGQLNRHILANEVVQGILKQEELAQRGADVLEFIEDLTMTDVSGPSVPEPLFTLEGHAKPIAR